MKSQKHRGFSLLEILLVITLLSILMGIVVLSVNPRNLIDEVNDNQREADALTIYQALEQYALKNDAYPPSINNMLNDSSAYICKTSATDCNTSTQINLSSILVPAYMSKIPEYSKDSNNSGFYVVKDSNGKIGIGGVKKVDNTTFVKGLDNQSYTKTPIPIVKSGLIIYLDAAQPDSYKENETTWKDLSGNENNGTLINGVGYTTANGGSLLFNGNNYVMKSNWITPPTNSFSIGCWVKFSDNNTDRYVLSFGRDAGDGPSTGGLALFAYGFNSILNNQLFFEIGSGTGRVSSGIVPILDTWYYLTVTADGNNTKFYLNGLLQNTSSQSTGLIASNPTLSIGSYVNSSGNPGTLFHSGNIAQVSIYNRALTSSEVNLNFNNTKFRFGL
jgi:prepilin-type N-terminal cleavage/methylation domain-containing protein